jgi:hypothetical protein
LPLAGDVKSLHVYVDAGNGYADCLLDAKPDATDNVARYRRDPYTIFHDDIQIDRDFVLIDVYLDASLAVRSEDLGQAVDQILG